MAAVQVVVPVFFIVMLTVATWPGFMMLGIPDVLRTTALSSGSTLPTSQVGSHTITVTAKSKAGDLTILGKAQLKQPFSPLFKSTLPYGSGMIVCKRAVEARGGRIDTDPFATSGPYQLISWVPRERLVLRRNPSWNGPRPFYDEIHLFPMNMNEGQTAFDAGDIDIARLNTSAISVARATAGKDATVTVRPGQCGSCCQLGLAT